MSDKKPELSAATSKDSGRKVFTKNPINGTKFTIAISSAKGGVGKSTLATGLFYFLKILKFKVEIVPELVKYKIYRGDDFTQLGFDIQNTLEQQGLEEIFEKGPMDFVICESPLCNGYFYSSFYKKMEQAVLEKIAYEKINSYEVVIQVHHPEDTDYQQFGRLETKEKSFLLEEHIYKVFEGLNFQNISKILKQYLIRILLLILITYKKIPILIHF